MVVPDKKRLNYFSWLTLFGMSAIGFMLITYLQKADVQTLCMGRKSLFLQITAGLFFGSLASLLAVVLLNGKYFNTVRTFFEHLMQDINPSVSNIVFYSVCASVGEEVLFRAGIQPLIGIWPASFLFVLLHGYINPANLHLSVYGFFLVVICAGFGYLFKFFGLTGSIIAHFIYDVSMFSVLKYSYQSSSGTV